MMLTIRDVERAVCQRFQVTREQLLQRDTGQKVARPRQIAMYLARELTGASYPRLGQHFERDHTSVLYAWRMTVERMKKDAWLRSEVESCKKILRKADSWKEVVARAIADRSDEHA
jgi:chromosomal replication initiator protein